MKNRVTTKTLAFYNKNNIAACIIKRKQKIVDQGKLFGRQNLITKKVYVKKIFKASKPKKDHS